MMKRSRTDTVADTGPGEAGKGGMSFYEFCRRLGKSSPYVYHLQSKLGLNIPDKGEDYTEAYLAFMQTVVSLRTFSVPLDDIGQLFDTEKKLLKLLNVDRLTHSRTWYLDACGQVFSNVETRLMLTGYDFDLYIKPGSIQSNLDFGPKEAELFTGHEMGEDARRVFDVYVRQRDAVMERVQQEIPVLERALDWVVSMTPRGK